MRACVIGSCHRRLDDRGDLAGVSISFAAALIEAGWSVDVVTRIGDDPAGAAARDRWRELGADDSRVQCDPDFATGRWLPRRRDLDTPWIEVPAAFDNLQWDGDLASAAAAARLIVTDLAGRRNAQARSAIDRVLLDARMAIRVLDLTAAGTAEMRLDDSSPLRSGLERVDVALVDAEGLQLCGVRSEDQFRALPSRGPRLVLEWNVGQPIRIATATGMLAGTLPIPAGAHPAGVLEVCLGDLPPEEFLSRVESTFEAEAP